MNGECVMGAMASARCDAVCNESVHQKISCVMTGQSSKREETLI